MRKVEKGKCATHARVKNSPLWPQDAALWLPNPIVDPPFDQLTSGWTVQICSSWEKNRFVSLKIIFAMPSSMVVCKLYLFVCLFVRTFELQFYIKYPTSFRTKWLLWFFSIDSCPSHHQIYWRSMANPPKNPKVKGMCHHRKGEQLVYGWCRKK